MGMGMVGRKGVGGDENAWGGSRYLGVIYRRMWDGEDVMGW